ncbi:MAG: hypothetical protein E6446_01660 [Gemella haemolysans]|nr:hypothetical protein [Gemella haemolysans]
MKKLVRTSLNNVANKRGVRDLNIQLYSHDKNNAGFEFVIKNEVDLSEYKAKVLFDFQESFATWETKGIIEGNVVKVKFDTTFITKCEEVIGYLFLDSETDTLDVFKFKFNVVLSEIDKYDTAKRGFRYIKDQEVVDVITRSELEEEIKKLQVNGGIDLSNYLTTSVANDIFATKQELGSYAKKTDLPAPYNDSALVERVTNLENKTDKDTVYDDTSLKERVTALERKAIEGGAYDDTHLRERLDTLEAKQDKDTVYDDAPLRERVTTLENKAPVDLSNYFTKEQIASTYATKTEIPQPYSDTELVKRITVLENKQDNDTVYDDAELNRRVTALEERPSVDTSNFVTKEELADATPATLYEIYRTDTLKETLDEHVSFINPRNVARDAGKIYLNPSSLVPKVFKGDIDNEKTVDLDVVMYSVANSLPDGYTLSDVENDINNKVLFLSNKNFAEAVPKEELKAILKEVGGSTGSNIDTSNLATKEELAKAVTKEELETKHYVTEEELENKNYLTQHQPLDNLVTKDDLRTLVTEIVNQLKSENN